MATWKKVITEDNVENLATADLYMTSDRDFTMGAPLSLRFLNEGQDDKVMFALYTSSSLSMCHFLADIVSFDSTTNIQAKAPGLILTSEVVGAAAGPVLTLTRDDDAAGVNGDQIGKIVFKGNKDNTGVTTYAEIGTTIDDSDLNAGEGSLKISLLADNVFTNAFQLSPISGASELQAADKVTFFNKTLKDIIDAVLEDSKSYSLKMYAAYNNNNGLVPGQGVLFRFNPLQPPNDIAYIDSGNESYGLNSSFMGFWEDGITSLSAASSATYALFDQDGGVNSGIGDAWFSHQRSKGQAQTVTITGSIWWKPQVDPEPTQMVRVFWAHEVVDGENVSDVTIEFDFKEFGDSYTLSSTNVIDKIPVHFSFDLLYNNGTVTTDLFIIGIENAGDYGSTENIGQTDPAVATITGAFVADLHVVVSN